VTAAAQIKFSPAAERAIAAIASQAPELTERQIALLKPLFSGR
jgi:hypothetical protein